MCRNKDAFVHVFDVTNMENFLNIEKYIIDSKRYCSRAIHFIIGNKIDLENRVVNFDLALVIYL